MKYTSSSPSSSSSQATIESLVKAGLTLLFTSIDNSRAFTQQLYDAMPNIYELVPKPQCPCEIPEQDCPPRCFCEVTWEALPGESLALGIHVTNSRCSRQSFSVYSTPFEGPGAPTSSIGVTPNNAVLAPGQTAVFNATYTVPTTVPQGEYQTEIVVRIPALGGYYERAVCVTLKIGCKSTCSDRCCTCCVEMGDVPKRIRAHQWYHHFQCVELCGVQREDVQDMLSHAIESSDDLAVRTLGGEER
jgi:hypothetical protein